MTHLCFNYKLKLTFKQELYATVLFTADNHVVSDSRCQDLRQTMIIFCFDYCYVALEYYPECNDATVLKVVVHLAFDCPKSEQHSINH